LVGEEDKVFVLRLTNDKAEERKEEDKDEELDDEELDGIVCVDAVNEDEEGMEVLFDGIGIVEETVEPRFVNGRLKVDEDEEEDEDEDDDDEEEEEEELVFEFRFT